MFYDWKIWCQTINYSLLAYYRWKQSWKITSETDFMAFLVKALFWWNKCSKNADSSVLSNILAIFFKFFLYIEKFYQVLSICQILDQLDHSNKLQRGQNLPPPPPPAIPICKKPGLFRVKKQMLQNDLVYLDSVNCILFYINVAV